MEQSTNQVILQGTLACTPYFSHENHGKQFFRFSVNVPRLSSAVDCLPVIAPAPLLESLALQIDDSICVTGQIRTHNIRSDGHRHLSVFVFASALERQNGEAVNHVQVEGILCREPTYRRTPLGREICDVMLAVPRAFQRSDYLPCILWGRTALEASTCCTGDSIRICGRLQSRQYTKMTENGPLQKTAYEVSALTADFPK